MDNKLPLKLAYKFATDNGLAIEISGIKEAKIAWKNEKGEIDGMRVRKGLIVQVLRERGLLEDFFRHHWPFGLAPRGPEKIATYDRARTGHLAIVAGTPQSALAAPGQQNKIEDSNADSLAEPMSTKSASVPPKTNLPPVSNAASLLTRVRLLTHDQAERNHEDAVKGLLVCLGFSDADIKFQEGRVDVCVMSERQVTTAVFEVKRSLVGAFKRDALRKAQDYSARTGAVIFVISDGDSYEIYDKRHGHSYDAMLRGRFQLTSFHEEDSKNLDLLRPASLQNTRQQDSTT